MFINFFQKNTKKATTRFTTTLILSAIIGLNFSNAQATDASLTWVGDRLHNGDWSISDNWENGDPNDTNYDATINGTGFRGVNLDQNFDIQTFNFNRGTLNTNSNTSLKVNETFNWTRGTLAGTGIIHAAGGLELGGGGSMVFKDSAIVINSKDQVANWNNNNFLMSFSGDSGFVNEADAVFIAKVDDGKMGLIGGRGKFDNQGAFVASLSSADKIITINTKMNNHGFVGSQVGELRLSGGGTSTGAFVAGEQGKITFKSGVHELLPGSSVTGASVEFGRLLGTTNIGGVYNVGQTAISTGATANFNAPESRTETLTLDGGSIGGAGAVVVTNETIFRKGIIGGPITGTAAPALLLANGGLKLISSGIKVIRGERIVVAGGENSSWEGGSIILVNGPAEGSDESRGSVLFNQGVFTAKAVGRSVTGPGLILNSGAFIIDLPELYEKIEGVPRKQIMIKSNFTNQGVLALQGANLLIGGELEEENILNNTETTRFNGNFTQTETGITTFKIAGNEQGMEYDTLDVFKIAILDGAFFIKLVDDILLTDDSAAAFNPEIGDFFDLVVAGEIIDNGFTFGGPHGHLFDLSIVELSDNTQAVRATFAPDLADFATIKAAATVVPIPSALWLFMSALFGILHIRNRQSK
jgi:hypothetical protein